MLSSPSRISTTWAVGVLMLIIICWFHHDPTSEANNNKSNNLVVQGAFAAAPATNTARQQHYTTTTSATAAARIQIQRPSSSTISIGSGSKTKQNRLSRRKARRVPRSSCSLSSTAVAATAARGGSDNNQVDAASTAAAPTAEGPLPPLPTLKQFRQFALPCLGLWVAQPLLSLVDTSFVGHAGGASESAKLLAALGPATTFFDGSIYLFAFLNVATTNLYSSATAHMASGSTSTSNPDNGGEYNEAEAVVRTAARVAMNCGLGLMAFTLATCRPLLAMYIGDKAASTPGLLDAATDYVKIRALSMPTSLLLNTIQAACLGAKDTVTPLVAVVYATVINVIGDYLLVSQLGWGLRGAAIATTAAQIASTLALITPASKLLLRDHSLGLFNFKKRKNEQQGGGGGGGVTGRAFLGFAAPVLTLVLGKLAAFGFMTHSAAAVPGQPTPLASHQIILSLLFFCSPFLEVISQIAQAFLPPFLAPVNSYIAKQKLVDPNYDPDTDTKAQTWLNAAQKVATTLLGYGFVAAAIVASIASLVPAYFGNIITSDTVVQEAVKPLAKYLWIGVFCWGPMAVSEGTLLARRELGFLAGVYLLSTALLPPALLQVKYRKGSVANVWACFGAFQLFRALCFVARIWGVPLWRSIFGGKKKPEANTGTAPAA